MSNKRLRRGHTLAFLGTVTILAASIPHAQAISGIAFLLLITFIVLGIHDRQLIARRRQQQQELVRRQTLGTPDPPGQYNSRYIPRDVQIKVVQRDGGRCRQCLATDDLQFDHIIPWSRGGANTADNIQLLCGSCNRAKSNRITA
jgi:HNH endonuclease